MCAQIPADTVAAAAKEIVKIWVKNPDFKIKDVPFELYQGYHSQLDGVLKKIKAKEEELTPLRNERDDVRDLLNDLTTQARSGIKGYFGPDSTEYELAGGTRASERKPAGRRKKTVGVAAK